MANFKKLLVQVACFGICLFLFTGVLWSRKLAVIGFSLRYDMIILAMVMLLFFVAISRAQRSRTYWLLACFSVLLCSSVLSGVWESRVSDLSLMAGIFPVSDSYSYLNGSLTLMHSGELADVASRRPIAPAVGGVLLYIFNGNIRIYLASLVFLVSLAMAWATRDMICTHGWAAGCVFYFGLFLFYRRFIGTVLTEHIGLLFGCVAFVLYWRSAYRRDKSLCAAGQAVLSIALCARAGAFFVLPAIALWGGRRWKGIKRFSLMVCFILCLAAVAGFGVNAVLARTIGTTERSFGNFSYVLYGLVHGGNWTQVRYDYPEIRAMSEPKRNEFIYERAFQSIRERPTALLAGGIRAIGAMLFSFDGLYSFVFFANQRSIREWVADDAIRPQSLVAWIRHDPYKYFHMAAAYGMFFFLLLTAGWGCLTMKNSPPAGLLLSVGMGILASSAFAPSWDSDLVRVYAATIPFMLAYPAIGSAHLVHKFLKLPESVSFVSAWKDNQTTVMLSSTAVIFGVCLLPLIFRIRARPASTDQEQSRHEGRSILFLSGVSVSLSDPAPGAGPWSTLSNGELIQRYRGVLSIERQDYVHDLIAAMQSGDTLSMAYDIDNKALRYVVCSSLASDGQLVQLPFQKHGLWWLFRPDVESD